MTPRSVPSMVASPPAPGRARGPVLLVLPRPDHVRGYAPLVPELARAGAPEVAVATGAPEAAVELGAAAYGCPFYRRGDARGGLGWLRFVVARERAARRLLRRLAPSVLVVPSDVADAVLPFVAGAAAAGIPVAYVQGAVVFPDYARRNDATYAAHWRRRGRAGRLMVRAARAVLAMTRTNAALGEKEVLGSRCDLALVMDERQRDVHRAAGVPAERLVVTGAPVVDGLVALRDGFGPRDRRHVREALGIPDGPVVVFLTKSLFQLGWATRPAHEQVIRDVVGAVRAELCEWTCVVKVHPSESPADYQALVGDDPRVIVTREAPVERLMLASDLVLSLGASSPAFAAQAFGLPLALINFTATEMLDAHADLTIAVPTFRTPDALALALREIGGDRAALGRLAARTAADRWQDGRASARVARHVMELARR